MAVAAPARKTAPAPAPSRTTPPRRKPAPARRAPAAPKPRGRAVAAPATAPARRAPARRAPARAPQRAPQRAKPRTKRAAGGQLIPLAVGRTAVAVRQLPDSGLVVRMTRGRAWIGVLGVLLVGIVALNVVTLSFAASSGKIDEQTTALEKENSVLGSREAQRFSTARIRQEAAAQGLVMPTVEAPTLIEAGPDDVATAAQRLAGAGPG
jgi:glucose/arabinose dehydrogenase